MRLLCALAFLLCAVPIAQTQTGRSQQPIDLDKIRQPLPEVNPAMNQLLKEDYAKNLEDLRKMQRLLWEVRTEMAKATPNVIPLQSIRKLEEIEKISKTIRSRLKLH
ncbi:MAG: hypothetical protein ABSC08_18025 [Bryobacteraceae bacterium]